MIINVTLAVQDPFFYIEASDSPSPSPSLPMTSSGSTAAQRGGRTYPPAAPAQKCLGRRNAAPSKLPPDELPRERHTRAAARAFLSGGKTTRRELYRVIRNGRPVTAVVYQHTGLDSQCRVIPEWEMAWRSIRREMFTTLTQ